MSAAQWLGLSLIVAVPLVLLGAALYGANWRETLVVCLIIAGVCGAEFAGLLLLSGVYP